MANRPRRSRPKRDSILGEPLAAFYTAGREFLMDSGFELDSTSWGPSHGGRPRASAGQRPVAIAITGSKEGVVEQPWAVAWRQTEAGRGRREALGGNVRVAEHTIEDLRRGLSYGTQPYRDASSSDSGGLPPAMDSATPVAGGSTAGTRAGAHPPE